MVKFKVGDKVRVLDRRGTSGFEKAMWQYIGKVLTIYETHPVTGRDYQLKEATIEYLTSKRWWWREEWLEPVKNTTKKLIVTTDGETTTAKLIEGKQTIKTATAKCSKDDEFCFETGAQIAVDRLLGKKPAEPEKPKFTKADLKNGMFGFNDDPTKHGWREWFVVVDDRLVYEGGYFDWLCDVHEDLSVGLYDRRISFVVKDVNCFDSAKNAWETDDIEFGTILYERK